ncbi:MAG: hypothetical protein Alpg2KO_16070 [Alphaproteobacteria bacterium]
MREEFNQEDAFGGDKQHVDMTAFLEWLGPKVEEDFLGGDFDPEVFYHPFFEYEIDGAFEDEFGMPFDGEYYLMMLVEEGYIPADMAEDFANDDPDDFEHQGDDFPHDDHHDEDAFFDHGDHDDDWFEDDWFDHGDDDHWEDDHVEYDEDYWWARGELEWRTAELQGAAFDQHEFNQWFEDSFGGEDPDMDAIWDAIDDADERLEVHWEVFNAKEQLKWLHRDFHGRNFDSDEFEAFFAEEFGDSPDVDDIYDEIDSFQERLWEQHDIENAYNELRRVHRKMDGEEHDRDAFDAWFEEEYGDASADEIWEAVDQTYQHQDHQRQIEDARHELEKARRAIDGDEFDEAAFDADFQDRFGGDDVHPEQVWQAVDEAWNEHHEKENHEDWGEDDWGKFWGDYWEEDLEEPVDFNDADARYWEQFEQVDESWEEDLPQDMLDSFYNLLAELNQLVEILYEMIEGTKGDDRLKGSAEDEQFNLAAGNDVANGGGGTDLINGGKGNDNLKGGGGEDELNGGANNDKLNGGKGDDVVQGGKGNDKVVGGKGTDELDGGAGKDKLNGGDGADELDGGAGKDKLAGGAGGDELEGGEGKDKLAGGQGNDTYIFNTGDGQDRITEAGGNKDKIIIEDTFNFNNLEFVREDGEDDLVIINGDDQITIKDHFADGGDNAVETLQLGEDGIKLDLVEEIDAYLI